MEKPNAAVSAWVDEMRALCKPREVVYVDGSDEQMFLLRERAVAEGIITPLNQERYPGCYVHRSAQNDVARSEKQTFICTDEARTAGTLNNWMNRQEAYDKLRKLYDGIMENRTMYVVPYIMGYVGSPYAKVGFELTDSLYVVLNMAIMTHMGKCAVDTLGEGTDFVKGLHSIGTLDDENRYICHFPEDMTIWSINSGYGGNALLGKKCHALRLASYQGYKEGWHAEHMLIVGIERPGKETKYIAAAFPSACGKTNLAMLIPPEIYREKGYKVYCVGDDIAWMHIGEDGRLWAVNPENGFFGVAVGTDEQTNPNAIAASHKNTIFTNIAVDLADNTIWWEGRDKKPPRNALNWQGEPWDYQSGEKAAHPNCRFTSPAANCPCISDAFINGQPVPISAIVFGGRRAKVAPLVYEAFNPAHGVFVGSIMASETTAASIGQVGVTRRDPFAMMPFCGYNMGDYFAHWLDTCEKLGDKAPRFYNVNWFRTDENGKFVWPGYGDNLRVLDWILDRTEGNADALETPIGYVPAPGTINTDGLDISFDAMELLLITDNALWLEDCLSVGAFYAELGDDLPEQLRQMLNERIDRLSK